MKRVREEEIRWKEPGYLGVLSCYDEQDQENEMYSTAYYISERVYSPLVYVTLKAYRNDSTFETFLEWEDVVAFCKKLRFERNLKPIRRQDSIVFRSIYVEIKRAIHYWTLCARRLGLPRDVRQMISEILYNCPWEWKN